MCTSYFVLLGPYNNLIQRLFGLVLGGQLYKKKTWILMLLMAYLNDHDIGERYLLDSFK